MTLVKRKKTDTVNNARLQVRLPARLLNEVKKKTEEEGFHSESAYVRNALVEHIHRIELDQNRMTTMAATLNSQNRRLGSLRKDFRVTLSAVTTLAYMLMSALGEDEKISIINQLDDKNANPALASLWSRYIALMREDYQDHRNDEDNYDFSFEYD